MKGSMKTPKRGNAVRIDIPQKERRENVLDK